jgi:hypothetical protein
LRSQVAVNEQQLVYKHRQMASKKSAFPFLRGTYYRWAEIWPQVCRDYRSAPTVLSIGDLHIENYGTWRDLEGRLVWGINDFDEAEDLPFTNDLVRLATSAELGSASGLFGLSFKTICRAIVTGYVRMLKSGGQPFVLEEANLELRAMAMQSDREPNKFWRKFEKELSAPEPDLTEETKGLLLKGLPGAAKETRFCSRDNVGMGSLGKPRYVALATYQGSLVAREAKALTPPSTACVGDRGEKRSRIEDVLARAIRCTDPIYRVDGPWVVRRLAPRCSRIVLKQLDCDFERLLFESMGAEVANIHLGTPDAATAILNWLESQPRDWLTDAAERMSKATRNEWQVWRKNQRSISGT